MAESGVCEPSRLLHILGMISAGRPLYNSDREYLDRIASQLADKESALRRENRRIRRVLGAGPDRRAAGRPASSASSRAEPAPVIDVPAAPPAAAGPRAAAAAPPAPPPAAADTPPRQPGHRRRSAPPAPAHTPPASSGSPTAPASRGASTAAPPPPQPAPAPAARHTLIDDASFDAILERRDRQQRSRARERAAEAIAAPPPPPPPPAQPNSPAAGAAPAPRGRLAGRLRGIVAGRR